ncbi:hypothetical protein CWATWH0005_31 [Crocosphaera watsonii WH 0005]|uniref:Uncharacterized protein n=1 Tax=Crocosphaera watsonii WH 0005 TaxID=423472 RepID=T2J1N7_CROWT|nr:hypothetical protein [Crocosphaera watsonii]CCQ59094.1 hypothetical protein CWATWH0005_31 [Crocosphaera watsonii WH 0005]
MASSDKSQSQDNQKKPTLVALIKKNKPENQPDSKTKAEEITPPKTPRQSRAKKSTSSTTKSKQTTKSTGSKKAEKTTTKTAQKQPQSKTPIKTKSQSQSTSVPKEPRKPTAKTPKTTNPQDKSKTSQKAKANPPSKTTPKKSSNTSPKTQSSTSKKTKQTTQKNTSLTQSKTQNESPPLQTIKPKLDPIQKALLYKNEKKQRLSISDYQDRINARDISLSISGLASIAAGNAIQAFLAGSLVGTLSLPLLVLFLVTWAKNSVKFHRTALDLKREQEAERKIAQLIKETYLNDGGEIYSFEYENPLLIVDPEGYFQEYLDIGLRLPNGQWLAISVKALKDKRDYVYIDRNTNILRYRNAYGLARWRLNPIDELKDQIQWFQENTEFFDTPPIGIVVFMEPTRVKLFDEVALKFGKTKVLCLDGIYVVREKDLLYFINEIQSRRKV